MKRRGLLLLLVFTFSLNVFSQMHVKKPNFTSFRTDAKIANEILAKESSPEAKRHPEYGITPYNAQCLECIELIDQRTLDSRQFVDIYDKGHLYSQSSFFPLHYKKTKDDIWRTIDQRLRPTGEPNVYAANNQPVPTKCDLDKKFSAITVQGYEFQYNRELSMYFFDDNTLYTKTEPANYNQYTIGEEGLNVKNMWAGIDMEQIYSVGQIKTSFVVSAPLQLPISSGWMVIEDHFTLPEGYTFEESRWGERLYGKYYRGDYFLRNEKGDTLLTYEKPIYVDAKAFGMHGVYKLLRTGNDYTLQMLVPVEWLSKPDNTYPLVIDPTVYGATKMGDFTKTGLPSANMAYTSMALGSCNYHMNVTVPGKSKLTNAYVDLEYSLTYDNTCGTPALPPPFCTFSQVTMEVQCDTCGTTTGFLTCIKAFPPYTGTCTTDSNLVPGANALLINSFKPNYISCLPPQCPDYLLGFTLLNRDSTCGDVCGYLCARGNMWRMTIEACRVDGFISQDLTQVCAGQPVTFTAHPNCGVPPYHFAWTQDGGNTYDTIYGTPNFVVHPQADVTVGCVIFDTCDITWQTNTLDVTVVPAPPADAGPDAHLCGDGGTVQLGGSPTSNPGNTILWTGETPTIQGWLNSTSNPNPVATVPAGTVDTFFYAVKATNTSCFRTDTAWVFAGANPVAVIDTGGPTTICSSQSVDLTEPGTFPFYAWSNGATTQSINVNQSGQYSVTVTDGNGCTASGNITVTVVQVPVIDAGTAPPLCGGGGTLQLGGSPTVTPGSNFIWSGENPTVESWLSDVTALNPTAMVPSGTVDTFFYMVSASNPGNAACAATDTVWVMAVANPDAIIDTSGPTKLCANQSVTISVTGTFASYLWSNGANTQSITVNTSGNYSATVTDFSGCVDSSNVITVSSIPVPVVHVYPDTLIMFGDSVRMFTDLNLSSAAIDSFLWAPDLGLSCATCANPFVSPPADQYYNIMVYAGGCTVSDSALIQIRYPNNFYIPNAFTPNGDGNNDDFYIKAQSGVKVLLFQVFNRWGEKVHEGSYPWDGNYKGKQSPPGVYIYVFKLDLFGDSSALIRKGSVTMIR